MQTIFIVEDDDGIRDMVVYALNCAGFQTVGVGDGGAFHQALRSQTPDLVLLDIMLPGQDGISILQKLREPGQAHPIPVIMLTAKGSELDRIRGLDLGADDYITKPFSVLEVISRVKAVLRRSHQADQGPQELCLDNLILSRPRRCVWAQGQEVELTYKEFELLYYLMQNQGIVLSRDRLLDQVWGFDYSGESRTVDMHIKSLRQKLGASGQAIKTVRNVGYKIGG